MFNYIKKIREYRESKCLMQEEVAIVLDVSYFLFIKKKHVNLNQLWKPKRNLLFSLIR